MPEENEKKRRDILVTIFSYVSNAVFSLSAISFLSNLESIGDIYLLLQSFGEDVAIVLERSAGYISILLMPYHISRDFVIDSLSVSISPLLADTIFLASILLSILGVRWLNRIARHSYSVTNLYLISLMYSVKEALRSANSKEETDRIGALARSSGRIGLLFGPLGDFVRGAQKGLDVTYLEPRAVAAVNSIEYVRKNIEQAYNNDRVDWDFERTFSFRIKKWIFLILFCFFVSDSLLHGKLFDSAFLLLLVPSVAISLILGVVFFILLTALLFLPPILVVIWISSKFKNDFIAQRITRPLAAYGYRQMYSIEWSAGGSKVGSEEQLTEHNIGEAQIFEATKDNKMTCVVIKHDKDAFYSEILKLTLELEKMKIHVDTRLGLRELVAEWQLLTAVHAASATTVNLQFCPEGFIVDSCWVEAEVRD